MIEAVLFDLDDTLLDRDKAVESMFTKFMAECYSGQEYSEQMLARFRELDNKGYSNKQNITRIFYENYPPVRCIADSDVQVYWDTVFPTCFEPDGVLTALLRSLRERFKIALITNGGAKMQRGKLAAAGITDLFDVIVISGEVGVSKPDSRIFAIALERLGVKAESAVFVGDHLVNDIGGAVNAGMRAFWLNSHGKETCGGIVPHAQISNITCLSKLLI